MHNSRIGWAGWLTATGFLFSVAANISRSADAPAAQPPGIAAGQADALVREALLAEADGNLKLRGEKLQQAVIAAPDSPAAHWQLGELRLGDAWQTIDDAAQAATHAGKVAEYRQRREQIQPTPTAADHLSLARWCRMVGLKDQERGHLQLALQLDPNSKEAISKLGLVRYRGVLTSPAEIAARKAAVVQFTADAKKWMPRLQQLRQHFEDRPSSHDEVLAEIRKIDDVAAIPYMERVLGNAPSEMAVAAVEALKSISDQRATESLARFAIFAQENEVRDAALDALTYRPRDNYMPILLAALKTPIQVECDILNLDRGFTASRAVLIQEGPMSNDVLIHISNFGPPIMPRLADKQASRIQSIKAQVDEANELNSAQNARLYAVLATITGQSLDAQPNSWWDWWFDQNEYYQPPIKPDNVTTKVMVSCFVRGTPVWTMTGPMPIEKIKTGEAVLSQDSLTGELAYKPVLATTYRPPSRTVEIQVGNAVVRGTRGHPFWVSGQGWQMAKQLHAGQCLHAAGAPQLIDAVTQTEDAECFNLVVADFHDYFVGDAKLLVHDNTLRGPTLNRVPGLAEDN